MRERKGGAGGWEAAVWVAAGEFARVPSIAAVVSQAGKANVHHSQW